MLRVVFKEAGAGCMMGESTCACPVFCFVLLCGSILDCAAVPAFGCVAVPNDAAVLPQVPYSGCVYLPSLGCGRGFPRRLGLLSQLHCR
jgi:hypothetical protein